MIEIEDFIGEISLFPRKVIMLGDLNVHVDEPGKSDVKRYLTCLETKDFHQHVMQPTHRSGHRSREVNNRLTGWGFAHLVN